MQCPASIMSHSVFSTVISGREFHSYSENGAVYVIQQHVKDAFFMLNPTYLFCMCNSHMNVYECPPKCSPLASEPYSPLCVCMFMCARVLCVRVCVYVCVST